MAARTAFAKAQEFHTESLQRKAEPQHQFPVLPRNQFRKLRLTETRFVRLD